MDRKEKELPLKNPRVASANWKHFIKLGMAELANVCLVQLKCCPVNPEILSKMVFCPDDPG
jgi:hypothetical protein